MASIFQKTLYGLGKALRETGSALERSGASLQGNFAFTEALNRSRRIMPLAGKVPRIANDSWIAPNATVIGEVDLGFKSSVWYGAVLRGDVNSIKVGANSSIGDRVVIHVSQNNPGGPRPTIIGDNVTIGQGALIHACTIESGSLVDVGAVVMDGAVVESGAIVGPGAVVTPGTRVKSGEYWSGTPARAVRQITAEEKTNISTAVQRNLEYRQNPVASHFFAFGLFLACSRLVCLLTSQLHDTFHQKSNQEQSDLSKKPYEEYKHQAPIF